jgi:fatty-acid desaturase
MANALLLNAARTAPVIIAGAAAVPAIAGLAAVATICLCSIMVVRHRTQSHVSLRVRKGQGFVFDVMKEADDQSALLTVHDTGRHP